MLKKKYGIIFEDQWDDQILHTYDGNALERRNQDGRAAYRVNVNIPDMIHSILLSSTQSTFLGVSVSNKTIYIDGAKPRKFNPPHGWQIVDRIPPSMGEFDENMQEMISQIENNLNSFVELGGASIEEVGVIDSIDAAMIAVGQSNSLDLDYRMNFHRHVNAGVNLLKSGGRVSIGALKFLIIDRLTEAYKDATEEVIKNLIKFALYGIIAMLIFRLGK